MQSRSTVAVLTSVALSLATSAAYAHTGTAETSGLVHGLAHPVGGLDHLLAMTVVGFLAAQVGGRAVWIMPTAFVAMMVVGAGFGVIGVPVPVVDIAVAASVVGLGVMVAIGRSTPLPVATALVGFFAMFHGYAHGAELPSGADAPGYAVGFLLATTALHLAGIVVARVLAAHATHIRSAATRLVALVVSLVGAAMVVSAV